MEASNKHWAAMEAAGISSSSSGGGGRVVAAAAITSASASASSPEKKVNSFVRAVALIEKLGDALGTLVFTWATVVLLGGYPTVLGQGRSSHFFYVVLIVSLEALRMFNRENSVDYQLIFRSRGSVEHLGWNGLIVVAWLSSVFLSLFYLLPPTLLKLFQAVVILLVFLAVVIGKFLLSPGALRLLPVTVRRFISLASPVAAVLLLIPSLVNADTLSQSHMIANWVMFTLLLVTVSLLTVSRLHCFPCVVKLLLPDTAGLGNKHVFWRRLVLNICMLAELLMLVFFHDDLFYRINMAIFQICTLLCVSFGNILMPAAFMRIILAVLRLVQRTYRGGGGEEEGQEGRINLEPSLDIFYAMVLGQGILHLVSCTLEMFSFLPRRSLARQGGFRGQRGSEAVNLYYEYALEKCMGNNDVAADNRKQMSLGSFAIHSISSNSHKLQLHGVWVIYNLLHAEPSRTQLISKLQRDANALARLINMLEWRSPEDAAIRLFAAKVIANAMLAGTLGVISVPRAMQIFSALLDADDSDGTETESQHDSLPGLALSIFYSLASNRNCDFYISCLKMSEAADDLIPKIVQFTCYNKDCGNGMQEQNMNEAAAAQKRRLLMESALRLLDRLSSIGGKIGVTLRHELLEHPILVTSLSAILEDRFSSQEAKKLAVAVLSNLAV